MSENPPFDRLGPPQPDFPVLISVPHAGRDYPAGFAQLSRLPVQQLKPLEDRYADLLVARAVEEGHAAMVARTPRVWIDLNRAEREFDPALVLSNGKTTPLASAKVRGGLGIIPRRVVRGGDIWRGPISADVFEARLAAIHRPWHGAIAGALDSMLARFGVAILIDLHSMPPLHARPGEPHPPQLVVGDLFGRSARGQFPQAALSLAERHGIRAALNVPYAGGHVLERHGQPARNVHALQIELDRALYLDVLLDRPSARLPEMRAFVARLAHLVAREARMTPIAEAAE